MHADPITQEVPVSYRSVRPISSSAHPLPVLGGIRDGLADLDLAVAIGEGREFRLAGAARRDVAVKRQVKLLEGVGEALGVTAGIMADLGNFGSKQRRISVHEPIAAAAGSSQRYSETRCPRPLSLPCRRPQD